MHTPGRPSRATVLIVAAKIGCDPRVAEKIIVHGPDAARNRVHRERAPEVLAEMGLPSEGGPRAA
jgi:hypothetical protein